MVKLVDRGDHFTCELHDENDAWELFDLVRSPDFEDKFVLPTFVGWPNMKIKYWRDDQEGVLTAPMMEGLLDLQSSLYRAFLIVEEQTSNLRHLSEDQRAKFEIGFKINEGSTEAEPKWTEIAKEFASTVATKVTGKQATLTILCAILTYGGTTAWDSYLDNKAEIAQAEASNAQMVGMLAAQRQATEADLEKFRILREVMQSSDSDNAILEASEEAKEGVLRSAKRVDATQIGNNSIEPEAAKRMSRIPRAETVAQSVSGTFEILRNDTTEQDGFRVRLRNIETGEQFFATLRDRMMSPQDRATVSGAEWAKTPISATVGITRRRGEIVKAQIISIERKDS